MDRDEMIKKSKIKEQKTNTRDFINLKSVIFNSRAGFTLIEVLIALTILSVGLLGVALMQVSSISGTTFSREMNVATCLAQDMLEKLRTLDYSSSTIDTAFLGGNHPISDDKNAGLAPEPDTDFLPCNSTENIVDERGLSIGPLLYIRTWAVTDDDPAFGMKKIAVTVCWKEKGTKDRSVTITGVKVRS